MQKRRHPRITPLAIRSEFELDGERREVYVTSLSEGGAFLACGARIPVGARLSVRLSLPWSLGELEALAEVVYSLAADERPTESSTEGVGVAFVDLRAEDRELIRRFVEQFRGVAAQLE